MKIEEVAHDLAREGFRHVFGEPSVSADSDQVWRAVRNTGTRLWLDTGDIEDAGKLWNAEFEALTTNNTLLNKEIQKGVYDEMMRLVLFGSLVPERHGDLIEKFGDRAGSDSGGE